MLGSAANVDLKGVSLLVATFLLLVFIGGVRWTGASATSLGTGVFAQPGVRTTSMLFLLIIIAQPLVRASSPRSVASALAALHASGLNAGDPSIQHRGYYEQLEVRAQPGAQLADNGGRGRDWLDLADLELLRDRRDVLLRDLQPSRSVVWNGHRFTTNEHGMRDKPYSVEKPADTVRIALVGPSHVMGNNVADDETFESLVEERLSAQMRAGTTTDSM